MDLNREAGSNTDKTFISYNWDRFKFKFKRHFVEVLKTKNTDQAVATGYALGSFVSILPTPGFSALLALLMVAVFKRINKISVFIAMAIWNVWTVIPFYWLSIKLGNAIYGNNPVIFIEMDFVDQAVQFSRRLLVGNLIILVPFSIFNYYLALWLLKKVRGIRNSKKDLRSKKTII